MNGLGRFYRGRLRASPEGRVGSERVPSLSCPGLKYLEAQDPSRGRRGCCAMAGRQRGRACVTTRRLREGKGKYSYNPTKQLSICYFIFL